MTSVRRLTSSARLLMRRKIQEEDQSGARKPGVLRVTSNRIFLYHHREIGSDNEDERFTLTVGNEEERQFVIKSRRADHRLPSVSRAAPRDVANGIAPAVPKCRAASA